ncbi:hypothetical protein [Parapedobacter sp.]
MAGYLFSLDNDESLKKCILAGVYSTRLSSPKNGAWSISHEGTFADYSTMEAGDNIYFFIKRKIYGIGTLVDVGGDCKFLNYPHADMPINYDYADIQEHMLIESDNDSDRQRFICTFSPSPHFFTAGIDMDDVLSSAPEKFKILRAFWKLSFIKFSDDENEAFKSIILRRNINAIFAPSDQNTFLTGHEQSHNNIAQIVAGNSHYRMRIAPFLEPITNEDGSLRHEMAIEAALLHQLSIGDESTTHMFGEWDYLSHQVIASPFKPVDYMDKMDVFGYKYIPNERPLIARFLVVEIKKDVFKSQDLLQLMKYVDWIKEEYAFGDYGIIDAFAVAHSFEDDVIEKLNELTERKYVYGVRPSISAEWRNTKLVRYSYDHGELLSFHNFKNANS